jgi:hypothetical protein
MGAFRKSFSMKHILLLIVLALAGAGTVALTMSFHPHHADACNGSDC